MTIEDIIELILPENTDEKGENGRNQENRDLKENKGRKKKRKRRKNTKPVTEFFQEDVVLVSRKKRKKKIGVIQMLHDQVDSDDDFSEEEILKPHQAKVTWSNGSESIENKKNLSLLDRSFMHGDVVLRVKDFKGTSGTVIDVNMWCTLKFFYKKKTIPNVHVKHLKFIHFFRSYAVYDDTWLCRVDELSFNLVIKFDDKSIVILRDVTDDIFDDVNTIDELIPFFPAMVLKFNSSERRKALRNGYWVEGQYKPSEHKSGLVINVLPSSDMSLDFLTCVGKAVNRPVNIDIRKLVPFSYYTYSSLNVGDHCIVNDHFFTLSKQELSEAPKRDLQKWREEAIDFCSNEWKDMVIDHSKHSCRVIQTKTLVDVQWQDGSIERSIPAIELQPKLHVDAVDHFCHDIVKLKDLSLDDSRARQYGIVESVDYKARIAQVRWVEHDSSETSKVTNSEVPIVEKVSTIELETHPDYSFRFGDIVLRFDEDDWVGEVIGINGNILTVCWSSRNISTVECHQVSNADEIFEKIDSFSDDDSQIESYTTSDEDNMFELVNQHMSRINGEMRAVRVDSEAEQPREISQPVESPPTIPLQVPVETESKVIQGAGDRFFQVESLKDFHFKDQPTQLPNKRFLSAIRKDWKLLKTELRNTNITVMVPEDNLYQMRAIIIGSEGTPYANGIFIFDFALPSDYPDNPPLAYFHSYGETINPNLYANGKVCLSLLHTWKGEETETWNQNSNIFQLLLSLTGIVLNSDPYFNEAGYDKQASTKQGIHNANLYRESAVLFVINHLIKTLRNPPNNTSDVIRKHLQQTKEAIFAPLHHYLSLPPNVQPPSEYHNLKQPLSSGFLIPLKKKLTILQKELENFQ